VSDLVRYLRQWQDDTAPGQLVKKAADRIEYLEAHAARLEQGWTDTSTALSAVIRERETERALADQLVEALQAASEWLPAEATGSLLDRTVDAALAAWRERRASVAPVVDQ
jgi:thiamine biosynthesis lipoprotein ApbE